MAYTGTRFSTSCQLGARRLTGSAEYVGYNLNTTTAAAAATSNAGKRKACSRVSEQEHQHRACVLSTTFMTDLIKRIGASEHT